MLGIFWSIIFVHMYIFMHGFQNKWMPISSVQAASGAHICTSWQTDAFYLVLLIEIYLCMFIQ